MISFRPLKGMVGKAVGRPLSDLATRAVETWEIAPGGRRYVPPAIFLPGQIERIRGTEFAPADVIIKSLQGDTVEDVGRTMGYALRDVDLVDGVLYGAGAQRHLRARTSRKPVYRRPDLTLDGVLYESWIGNRWFGSWLIEDCLTYMLAEPLGDPVTTAAVSKGHAVRYESLLNMAPKRVGTVHFDRLTLIDDLANNPGKSDRAKRMRMRLVSGYPTDPVPGVFLLRGSSGDLRILENERQIAEQLARDYGFHVVDPMQTSVDDIVALCGRARIVAGVEGSHLVHGLVTMPQGATLLVIQPPFRVTTGLKLLTDREDQRFAMVVAEGTHDRFRVAWDDIRRTLDLL